MNMDLPSLYRERALRFESKARAVQSKYNRFSFIRLGYFLMGIIGAILLWPVLKLWTILYLIVFIYSFYRFVLWHLNLQQQKVHLERLTTINQYEEKAMDHDYPHFNNGETC